MDSSSNAQSWPAPPGASIAGAGATASAAAANYAANLAARGRSSSVTGRPRTPAESSIRHGSGAGDDLQLAQNARAAKKKKEMDQSDRPQLGRKNVLTGSKL